MCFAWRSLHSSILCVCMNACSFVRQLVAAVRRECRPTTVTVMGNVFASQTSLAERVTSVRRDTTTIPSVNVSIACSESFSLPALSIALCLSALHTIG